MKSFFSAMLVVAGSLLAARPGYAFDINDQLESVFGTSKPQELALPMFIGLIAVTVVLFLIVMAIGRRRQKRMISDYQAVMSAHSKALRKGSVQRPRR